MATPAQIKKRDKYADKPKQVINNNIRLDLGEFNQVSLEVLNSDDYVRTFNRALAKDSDNEFTRAGGAYWFKNKEEALTTLLKK